MNGKNKAVFFDRDGIVNYRLVGDYVTSIEEFKFIDDFLLFYSSIKKKGYLGILVKNQEGIGKGILSEENLEQVHTFLQSKMLELTGYNFDDIFYCSDLAESNSPRRKPNPGMIFEAIEKWNIEPRNSWMIGDSPTDVIAGKRAGLNTILVNIHNKKDVPEAEQVFPNLLTASFFFDNFIEDKV
ncbi:MAG: HAD-IIIA family hydrolase [Bacteroidota bacterium]